VREVMQQESGGRLYDANGYLTTSTVGAMGLMQVMPQTYDMLRDRYGLGADPYEPHSNIIAGTAYIREMYDRYGAPGFLAAYDAGPDRVDAYLSGGNPLPDETISYLASVVPRLGSDIAMTGPLAALAGNSAGQNVASYTADRSPPLSRGERTQYTGAPADNEVAEDDRSRRAFDGGGLVTAAAPTGELTSLSPTPVQHTERPVVTRPVVATANDSAAWGIQVGAYSNATTSGLAIQRARANADDVLAGAWPTISPVQHGTTIYRARLMGLSPSAASAACARLAQSGLDCVAVPPGS
jgi:D-alanyl-D-alanine carboxypeptidase